MTVPVKTLILREIRNTINALECIGEVVRNPAIPPNLEVAIYPVVFIFDEIEQRNRRNRLAINLLPLHIEVWLRADLDEGGEQADLVDAEIYKALTANPGALGAMDIMPDETQSSQKQYPDDQNVVLVLKWVVKYGHKWGDPMDPQIQ